MEVFLIVSVHADDLVVAANAKKCSIQFYAQLREELPSDGMDDMS